jgi:tRNA1Val (adenine37-N6)-methyltransferase
MTDEPEITLTHFLGRRLRVWQPRHGYRFALDAPLLADFIRCGPAETILEAGTGCGIVPLLLAFRTVFRKLTAVELQPELAELARRNMVENGMAEKVAVLDGDIRQMSAPPLPDQVDQIIANPPYRKVGQGRLNPLGQKAAARHELFLSWPDLLKVAGERLAGEGSLSVVHLAERERELLAQAAGRFQLVRRRRVFSFPGDAAPRLVLLHWRKRPCFERPVEEMPPLVIHDRPQFYSTEFQRIIDPGESRSDGSVGL